MVSSKEIDVILSGSYRWITVPKYRSDPDRTVQQDYRRLEEHHIEETIFLINKVKELAQQVKDLTPHTITTQLPGMDGVEIIESHPQLIREDKWK